MWAFTALLFSRTRWDEGVKQMSKGQRAKFEFTPDLGYGAGGYPPVIPPNSNLFFDIELIDMS